MTFYQKMSLIRKKRVFKGNLKYFLKLKARLVWFAKWICDQLINGQAEQIIISHRNDLWVTNIYNEFHDQRANLKKMSND